MTKSFSALLWKERVETWRMGIIAVLFYAIRFYNETTSGFYGAEAIPVFDAGAFGGLTVTAFFMGVGQTLRESKRDMQSFAVHRPATHRQIFGAKLLVGGATLTIPLLLVTAIGMGWLSMAGDRATQLGPSILKTALVDFVALSTFYAAGLFFGSHGEGLSIRLFGFGVAIGGLFFLQLFQSSAFAVAVCAFLTIVLATGAWRDFFASWDFAERGAP